MGSKRDGQGDGQRTARAAAAVNAIFIYCISISHVVQERFNRQAGNPIEVKEGNFVFKVKLIEQVSTMDILILKFSSWSRSLTTHSGYMLGKELNVIALTLTYCNGRNFQV